MGLCAQPGFCSPHNTPWRNHPNLSQFVSNRYLAWQKLSCCWNNPDLRMSEREKQSQFLKELIREEAPDASLELQNLIVKAERDEKCIGSAVRLVGFLALLATAGLGYSAVFVPQFFHNSTPLVVKFFTALVLACLICMVGFLGFWFWYRAICNRLYQDCRNLLISLHRSGPPPLTPFPSALVHKQGAQVYTIVTRQPEHDTEIITLPQAS
jgi:hypothetical protein